MSTWDKIALALGLALSIAVLALAFGTYGCSSTLTHEIAVKIDLDDECLASFPICNSAGAFACVTVGPAGGETVQPDCRVTCVAARDLLCESDGPHCYQIFGEDLTDFPVFCTGKNL